MVMFVFFFFNIISSTVNTFGPSIFQTLETYKKKISCPSKNCSTAAITLLSSLNFLLLSCSLRWGKRYKSLGGLDLKNRANIRSVRILLLERQPSQLQLCLRVSCETTPCSRFAPSFFFNSVPQSFYMACVVRARNIGSLFQILYHNNSVKIQKMDAITFPAELDILNFFGVGGDGCFKVIDWCFITGSKRLAQVPFHSHKSPQKILFVRLDLFKISPWNVNPYFLSRLS